MLKDLFNRLEFLQFNPNQYLQDQINYSSQRDLNILILLASFISLLWKILREVINIF